LSIKQEQDRLIAEGDAGRLRAEARDPERSSKLLRRIQAGLYSTDPITKWKSVSALGKVAEGSTLSARRIQGLVSRFLWAMSDESGAVPYGIPEALGELLAARPELRAQYTPILVSYLVHEELVQTGPILAGAIWALGRVDVDDPEESRRALPGLEAALTGGEADVSGAALWALPRLGLAAGLAECIRPLAKDDRPVWLLADGDVLETTVAVLAKQALSESEA
jgi:hypothetical protein